MQIVEEYKGYTIVETDWTTEVKVGFDQEEVRAVYIIRGLKERPSRPFLTTVEQCREYIDEELEGRARMDEAMSETWEGFVRAHGNAYIVTIPVQAVRRMGLEVGDPVRVTLARKRAGTGGENDDATRAPRPMQKDGGR